LLCLLHKFAVFSGKATCPRGIVNARCSSKLAHPSGVEPDECAHSHKEILLSGHKDGHKKCDVADFSLQIVVKIWPKLPAPLKAAILAIINSSEVAR
jgi:hypothetical protein